jgi:hypothetical protein
MAGAAPPGRARPHAACRMRMHAAWDTGHGTGTAWACGAWHGAWGMGAPVQKITPPRGSAKCGLGAKC